MKCQHCGGERFYVARTYKGTEVFDVKEIEHNEDDYSFAVMTGSSSSDEYLAILDESVMCSNCYEEVLDDDSFSEFTKTWE